MAANPDNPDEFATKGDLADMEKGIRNDMRKMEKGIRADIELLRFDMTALTGMVRTIMDHLGISEPSPPAR